jgi:tetratricopeptide (TPR) repeat protein
MVTKNSAERISARVRDIDHLPSNTDHRGLVRFDHARDDRYVSVIRKIREIAAHASQAPSAPVQSSSLRDGHSYHATEPVKYFVPRVSLEDQIKGHLHDSIAQRGTSPRILTVYGLGGAGKSQLVLSYVRAFRRDYSSVFIIDASTKASIELDYQQVYRTLYDPLLVKPSETLSADEAINAVKSWLNGRDGRCLLVFDSADNMHNSHAADFFRLSRYLPASSYLDVIITTRTQPTKGLSEFEVEVKELHPEEGAQLFLRCSGTKDVTAEVTKEVTEIVTELGHFALAVTLAGAWVSATHHKGIKDYLSAYRKQRSVFLRKKANSNAHQYGESVFTTWEMSYEAVSEQCPAAANMLSFLAFLDNSDILLRLLDAPTYVPDGESPASDPCWQQIISPSMPLEDAMDEVFSTLAKYSMLKWNNDTGSYSMRKLVHAWGHDRLAVQEQAKYGAAALECLAMTDLRHDWDPMLRARLVPHIMVNFSTIPGWFDATDDTKENTLERVRLVANFLREAGLYGSEKDLRMFEIEKREGLSLVGGDLKIFRAASQLASALWQLGMYEEAAKLDRRALEGREKVLGKEHPDTIGSVSNLASGLHKQGELTAAEKLYRQVVESTENVLGKNHPDTLTSVNNLALVLRDQGEYKAAGKLHLRALEGRERMLGKENPATLTSVDNLASVLQDQGEYVAAEELYQQASKGRDKVLGREHPASLMSVWCLADLMEVLGRTTDALPLYERAVTGFSAVLGSDHPTTVACEREWRELQQKLEDGCGLDHSPVE